MKLVKFIVIIALLITAFCAVVSKVEANTRSKPVEADPNKAYYLKQTDGPWLILVKSFSDRPEAEQDAHALALDIRKNLKLPAYVFSKDFMPELKEEEILTHDPRGLKPKVGYRIKGFTQYSVLVGDFQSAEDRDYEKVLKRIKSYQPKLEFIVGPLGTAFGAPNPMLPPDYFSRKTVDQFIISLNSQCKNSLLDCTGKYTLKVATFTGASKVFNEADVETIKNIESKKELAGDQLVNAAKRATLMCEALRLKGYPAYVFHDRFSSIVAVGSFDYFEMQHQNGQKFTNPEIKKLAEVFSGNVNPYKHSTTKLKNELPIEVKSISGLPFDAIPKVIEVPQKPKTH